MSAKPDNRRLLGRLLLVVVGMFGFGFALVPLYDVFCDITGLNGKTANVAVSRTTTDPVDRERLVTVQFLANINQSAPWEFRPQVRTMRVHPGEFYQTSFYAQNLTDRPMVGQAIPSVAPGLAAGHFHKVECFCFNRQPFEAGEGRDMPLAFRIDPDLDPDISTITLSYTFFRLPEQDS
ncbi:MAG: cytochrome c oxidase assembly protein [Candidatus Competibacteraceae bacterium]|nr:cytochrome c oxidase assembly protein [Candidatus Competibacteraceae bacterium]